MRPSPCSNCQGTRLYKAVQVTFCTHAAWLCLSRRVLETCAACTGAIAIQPASAKGTDLKWTSEEGCHVRTNSLLPARFTRAIHTALVTWRRLENARMMKSTKDAHGLKDIPRQQVTINARDFTVREKRVQESGGSHWAAIGPLRLC